MTQTKRPNYVLWMLCVFMLLSAASYSVRPKEPEISYAEVVQLFEQEKVKSFTVQDTTLTLKLREAVDGKTELRKELYDFDLFYDDLNDLVVEQKAAGILEDYNYSANHSPNYLAIALPYVIAVAGLFAIWYFFSMRASGMGFRAIAVTINEEGVLPPGALYYQRKGRSDPRNVNHKWAETTVKALIRSEVYIGNMVQGKTGTLSYKSRKLINKPEEEWIRVEGTHEPIISREVWDTVVSIDKKKVRKTPPTDGIRSIYCADCGFKMRNHIERFTYKNGTPGRYSSFICGNYARSGKSACTIHSIYENVLEELVLTDIREKARFVECDGERLAEQISRMKEKESRSRVISYEQELKAAAARMTELERLMQNLYEDKCTGTIPQTVFQTLMRKYETERAEKAAAIPELEQKVRAQLENRQDANRWMEVIRRYTEITALDESILFELVDRIEVGEARKVNGQRICDVKVVYRYVGSGDDALAQERQEAYEKAI